MKPADPTRRPRRARAVALAVALLALAVAALPTRAQSPAAGPTPCLAIPRIIGPTRLALVDNGYDVTTTVTTLCPAEVVPLHIMLVLDASSSMAGAPSESVRQNARELIDRLSLKDHPGTQVGVIAFNTVAEVLCQLTNRASQAIGCVGRVGAEGGSNIAAALRLGLDALARGRTAVPAGTPIREVIVVVTDGANSGGCDELVRTANEVKGEGVLLMSVCVTGACAAECIRTIATSPRYHFGMEGFRDLIDRILSIREFLRIDVVDIAVTETIGAAFVLDERRVSPTPASSDGRRLAWRFADVPREGVTMTLGVRTTVAGADLPVLVTATGTLRDSRGRRGVFDLRVPRVDVLDARTGLAPTPVADTTPLTNVLALDARAVAVGGTVRARYRLRLPDGDGERLKLSSVALRVPDHMRVVRTWRDGKSAGQPDWDPRLATWSLVGVDPIPPDALDLEAELVASGPGEGGVGIVAYGWGGVEYDRPIAAAVSAPLRVDAPGPTALPSPTGPAPTATQRSFRIHLPLALAEACLAGPANDIVTVIDTSTSMAERLAGGGTKQAAAVDALDQLVARLDPVRDRLALVTFDRTAMVRRPLGSVGPGVVDALRAAPLSEGTAMGSGLLSAGAVLAAPERRPAARGIVLLLTDGRSSPDAPAAAVAAADALRAAGSTVLVVGLGPEVDRAALDDIAGGRGAARVVADAVTLGHAFGSVGGRLGCVDTGSWGGRFQ